MTLRLTVDTRAWESHVRAVAERVTAAGVELVPVVKGNGYGFGRAPLAAHAVSLIEPRTLAVGTVHELDLDVVDSIDVTVLTPTLRPPADASPILTVASPEHVDALDGWPGRVVVKLTSSMRRYGDGPELADRARRAGRSVVGWSVHPPLTGGDDDHAAEIARVVLTLPPATPGDDPEADVWISHVSPEAVVALPAGRRYRLRLGTALWHGDKSMLHLTAEVLARRTVSAGEHAGYRLAEVPGDGTLVMIGAGTAHGVTPLPDGRSPFHHARRRLALLEAPHMHTAMAFVPAGDPVPGVGDRVDVQRPLTMTLVDELEWT